LHMQTLALINATLSMRVPLYCELQSVVNVP